MKLCDLHTHSNNSFDAQSSVDEMCLGGIAKGLYAMAITDHCEAPAIKNADWEEYGNFDELLPKSFKEASLAKEKYSAKIKIIRGIELGEPMHDLQSTEKALGYGNFDFVIASVHNLRNMPDFYYLDFQNMDMNKILNLYFDELAETAEFKHFNTLAHITYPLRYIKEKTGAIPSLEPYQSKLDNIYKILIKNNKALEINTQGLYKCFGTTLPDEQQIKRFKQLGGEYVTIGSDSHTSQNVGCGIKEGTLLAKKCGFTHYTIFENQKPTLIEII